MKRLGWILMAALASAPCAWACGNHGHDKDMAMSSSLTMSNLPSVSSSPTMASLPGPGMRDIAEQMAESSRDLRKAVRVNANSPNYQRSEMLAMRWMDQLAERADDLRDAIAKHGTDRASTADEFQDLATAYYGMMRTVSYLHAPNVVFDELRPVQNLMDTLAAYYGGLGTTTELEHRSDKLLLKEDEEVDYSELKASERAADGVLLARADVQ